MRDVFSARWSLIALVNSATVASIDSERASKRNEVIFAFVSYKWRAVRRRHDYRFLGKSGESERRHPPFSSPPSLFLPFPTPQPHMLHETRGVSYSVVGGFFFFFLFLMLLLALIRQPFSECADATLSDRVVYVSSIQFSSAHLVHRNKCSVPGTQPLDGSPEFLALSINLSPMQWMML